MCILVNQTAKFHAKGSPPKTLIMMGHCLNICGPYEHKKLPFLRYRRTLSLATKHSKKWRHFFLKAPRRFCRSPEWVVENVHNSVKSFLPSSAGMQSRTILKKRTDRVVLLHVRAVYMRSLYMRALLTMRRGNYSYKRSPSRRLQKGAASLLAL